MDDIIKYFRYAMLFPIIVSIFVIIVLIPLLYEGNYEIVYGNESYFSGQSFVWPTPGFTTISSPFGRRTSPTAGASSYHKGIDIAAYQGSDVLAIAGGTVTFAGWNSSGGYMVVIQHENNVDSRYCHLGEKIFVTKGQKVYAGQIIATVGPKYVSSGKLNGATNGVHLHLGIRVDEKFVNPLQYFDW